METGTDKTYVYVKTMFELNKLYGWSKFIVVVPSIAIREGIAKSFRMLEEHFMEQYGKKARWFVYNSSNLNQLDQFSQDAGLNVMIINTQAFAASLKEGYQTHRGYFSIDKKGKMIDSEASRIMVWLEDNEYIDDNGNITPKYHADVAAETVAPHDRQLEPMAEGVTLLINSIFDPNLLKGMTEDGSKTKLPEPRLNANYSKPEFQTLWKAINHQYVYTVSYDTAELIDNAVRHLNTDELQVRTLRYIKIVGTQTEDKVDEFGDTKSTSQVLTDVNTSSVKYDLVGQVAKGANITRRTTAKILQGLRPPKLALFRNNPEEFIRKIVQIIR